VQGDAGHPGGQGGGKEKNNRKKWRTKVEERHKGSHTPKNLSMLTVFAVVSLRPVF
jgi:hypothetical protein